MIKLIKDGLVMEVRSQLQASVFLTHGYKVVEESAEADVPAEESAEIKISEESSDDVTHYKKSEISRMSIADLKDLATKLGISDAENTSGEKLKEEIITKLGL